MALLDTDGTKTPTSGLAWRLHELLSSSPDAAMRRLSFLALDPARKHFGVDWMGVAAKVHGIVNSTLRTFLSEGDIYSAADEFSYIIMSSNRDPSEFDKLMEDISSEISSRLTGKGIAKQLVSIVHLSSCGDLSGAAGTLRRSGSDETVIADHLSNIERIISDADAGEEEFSFSSVSYRLASILSTDVLASSAWLCVPAFSDGDEIIRCGYGVLPSESAPLLYAELDALTLEFAAKKLKEDKDRRVVVQIPVHRETLSSKKYREMYLKICRGLLSLRKDNVIFDIHGIDEGTPSNRVSEYMQWLRPYARAIAVTVNIDFSTISTFTGANTISIGADLSAADGECTSQRIGKFVGRVKAANAKCHVHGIVSKTQADLCLRLGVEYLDGNLISDGLT
ncbi:MAG: hypothetical protein EPN26_11160 [Rhodospirillales bacterium]|nr:MAG: hypothetical protein EPN26_11160 [Rhodospirillales bacterium]